MKKLPKSHKAGVALAVLSASIGLASSASAINLFYREDPDGAGGIAIGDPYIGPVEFKFVNVENSATYALQGLGIKTGYSGVPSAVGEAGGVQSLDGIGLADAGFALNNGPYLSNGVAAGPGVLPAKVEDLWGLARVTQINAGVGGAKVWEPGESQLEAVFYGHQDTFIEGFSASENRINGVGLKLDLYEDFANTFLNLNTIVPGSLPGTAGHAGLGVLQSTAITSNGPILALSIMAMPGFLHTDAGAPAITGPGAGGSSAAFESIFSPGSITGRGSFFADVIGGADMAKFDTSAVSSPASLFNAGGAIIASPFADLQAQFTASPGSNGWFASSNDPFVGNAIPEPSSVLAGVGCMLPMFGMLLGRRRPRQVTA